MDLIDVLYTKIVKAKNILEIGCGSGIFGIAYLERFPNGIPGQTIYCTDLNPSMVEVAQCVITEQQQQQQQRNANDASSTCSNDAGCLTKFIFQSADATNLDMFPDDTFDMVISVFGLFLIPDREKALSQVRRVLQKRVDDSSHDGILAMTAWTTTGYNEELRTAGFGANLHDAMSLIRLPNLIPASTTTDNTGTTESLLVPNGNTCL
jgi:ubiquinone/menaquinone biosynthesis C-methylase UbiE